MLPSPGFGKATEDFAFFWESRAAEEKCSGVLAADRVKDHDTFFKYVKMFMNQMG